MKRLLLTFLLFLTSFLLSAQEDYTITRILYLPPTFYVGDLVELRVNLETEPGRQIALPSTLPDLAWIRFDDMALKVDGQDAELRIRFSTFFPGTRSLPDLQLGDIMLQGIKIHTESVITQENSALAPPRPQILLPGTMFYLIAILALVILLPVTCIPLFRRLYAVIAGSLHRQREGRIYRKFQKELQGIRDQVEAVDSRTFYIRLTDRLRQYLSGRTGKDFITTTSREIKETLTVTFSDAALNRLIGSIFLSGDVVKFSGKTVKKNTKLDELTGALEAAARIEEYMTEKTHVDS